MTALSTQYSGRKASIQAAKPRVSNLAVGHRLLVGIATPLNTPYAEHRLIPGLGIDTVVSFDVPPGSVPEEIELHDSAFSGGVLVKLK